MAMLTPLEYQAAINEVLINKKLISDVATDFKIAKRTLYILVKAQQKPNQNRLNQLQIKIQTLQQQLQVLQVSQC
ncbi:hypothetical protein [Pseudoalteromonas tunicata]|jgi:hypothetical protein|uniref:HTH psq-type domain-containing protein n=1 Tax=Pseudoalteromonas tunicata D2 TaxID=87626 RepID=A4C4J1_9GAMM|nr:hypothetical protein [Pseudoalteromonas tunicata]ATC97045.1 hypothetical protein PTUN_b0701 [Pseudoalteromonas tunicata]AXT33163.1 hypothetical protein D1819_20310 [Pseudoalteromonas tunicata]EAR30473.1 hypothetical protein PTD2_02851 [Pseudoalteromonas tunicata D2]